MKAVFMGFLLLGASLCSNARHTSEESHESVKSVLSAVSSVLGLSEGSRSRHAHSYDDPPHYRNAYGKESGLYLDLPVLGKAGVASHRYVERPATTGAGYLDVRSGYPAPYNTPPTATYPGPYPPNAYPHGYPPAYAGAPVGPQYPGYAPPAAAGPQQYRGNGGYSVLNHSLKTNSEYKEVGHHEGPFQGNRQGYGYGSGYGGGYNGAFNRPVF